MSNSRSWNEHFMRVALLTARMSTCARIQTGAVVVKNKHIISTGHNGVCSGEMHCVDYWADKKTETFYEDHHKWSVINELHAEQNALIYAGKNGQSTIDADLYTVYSPCINCAKVIKSYDIKTVYYRNEYTRDSSGIDFLKKFKINCIKI